MSDSNKLPLLDNETYLSQRALAEVLILSGSPGKYGENTTVDDLPIGHRYAHAIRVEQFRKAQQEGRAFPFDGFSLEMGHTAWAKAQQEAFDSRKNEAVVARHRARLEAELAAALAQHPGMDRDALLMAAQRAPARNLEEVADELAAKSS